MRTSIIILMLVFCQRLLAQEVIATAGNTLSSSNGSISFTIGESVAQTLIKGDKSLTQGFQQSFISVSIVSKSKDLEFSITVYPNPASDVLTLKLSKEDVTGIQYLLYDIMGNQLLKKNLESNETSVPVSQLVNGFYILKVQTGINELKIFKIIKQ